MFRSENKYLSTCTYSSYFAPLQYSEVVSGLYTVGKALGWHPEQTEADYFALSIQVTCKNTDEQDTYTETTEQQFIIFALIKTPKLATTEPAAVTLKEPEANIWFPPDTRTFQSLHQ